MSLTYFRPRGDVAANWKAANPVLKEREMVVEWESAIGVGQPRVKFGKAGGTTHYNDTDYAILPIKYNTKSGWSTANPILAVGEMGIEWETTIGEGAVCIKFGNGTTVWNSLEYASTGRLKEIIEPETENTPVAVGDTLPMIAGKINSQQDFLKTKLGYERLDALAASLSGLSNQDFVGIMDFINQKKFDKSSVYNGLDSSNTELALAAPQGKALQDKITKLNSDIFPKNHASTATTYGLGTASNYGHVKLSDSYISSGGAASNGVAASSKALVDCRNNIMNNIENTNADISVTLNKSVCSSGNMWGIRSGSVLIITFYLQLTGTFKQYTGYKLGTLNKAITNVDMRSIAMDQDTGHAHVIGCVAGSKDIMLDLKGEELLKAGNWIWGQFVAFTTVK